MDKSSVWLISTRKHNELIMLFYNKRKSGKIQRKLALCWEILANFQDFQDKVYFEPQSGFMEAQVKAEA